jgi:hypothetical protein
LVSRSINPCNHSLKETGSEFQARINRGSIYDSVAVIFVVAWNAQD